MQKIWVRMTLQDCNIITWAMSSTIFGPQFDIEYKLIWNYVQLREVEKPNREWPLAEDFIILRVCAKDPNTNFGSIVKRRCQERERVWKIQF